jgi:ubiquinone/menaquinone biosynthesis C-methylase UbiE
MLKRVLEPEVMDDAQAARTYDEMDHSEVNRVFVDDLLQTGDIEGDILDLGTGTAQIPVELCKRIDNCRVMASDASYHMLDLARYQLEIASLTDRIQLDMADAKQMPYESEMFDIVISNSIVHHIPDPIVVLQGAIRVTKPGGLLFFRDLMRPDTEEQLDQIVEKYSGKESEHAQQLLRDSLHAALNLAEIREMITELGFDPDTVQATSDRHWTWIARRVGRASKPA